MKTIYPKLFDHGKPVNYYSEDEVDRIIQKTAHIIADTLTNMEVMEDIKIFALPDVQLNSVINLSVRRKTVMDKLFCENKLLSMDMIKSIVKKDE